MAGARNLTIEYEKRAFLAGENLRARVKFELEAPLEAEAVYVDINGHTHTNWEDMAAEGGSQQIKANEVYLREGAVLWRGERLEAGKYNFPFGFKIPQNAPSTFRSSDDASTVYYCRARICDQKVMVNFNVIALCDLKTFPNSALPLKAEKSSKTGVLFFNSGHVDFAVTLPRSGFLSGETVPFNVAVCNQSAGRVTGLKLKIIQFIQLVAHSEVFGGQDKKWKEAIVLAEDFGVQIDSHTDRELQLELKIPPLPPTQLECRLVQIKYGMVFKLVQQNVSLKNKFAVIVGSAPFEHVPVVSQEHLPPSALFEPEMFQDQQPPPSYDDVMKT